MQLMNRWIDRDLSRLEMVVAWIVILLLVGLFARYMLIVFARAERSMVNMTIINVNTSLKYQAVLYLMKEDYKALARLGKVNPMNTMQGEQLDELLMQGAIKAKQLTSGYTSPVQPANYIGEFHDPNPEMLQKGVWYYDTSRDELVYIIRNDEFFRGKLQGAPRLRFKVKVEYADNDGNGMFDPPLDTYQSVRMVSVDHYAWAP
jgi:hypothetical protein